MTISRTMKTLDISTVKKDLIVLEWLTAICEANNVEEILISEEQQYNIFSSPFGAGTYDIHPWTHLRTWKLNIKPEPRSCLSPNNK